MKMQEAALVAICAGITVGGMVWVMTGMLANVQHMLKQRLHKKTAAALGDTPDAK